MNNDLEQFSEERLMEIANFDEDAGLYPSIRQCKALARIALAAKQGKLAFIPEERPDSEGLLADGWNACRSHMLYTPQPAHTEQDGYWYEVECYKYKGPAKLCAGNDGPAWFFPGSDLLVDNDEVKVIGRAAAPKPESE